MISRRKEKCVLPEYCLNKISTGIPKCSGELDDTVQLKMIPLRKFWKIVVNQLLTQLKLLTGLSSIIYRKYSFKRKTWWKIIYFLFSNNFAEPTPFGQLERNENHPWWNTRVCHLLGNSNVLICGKKQAQALTKTLLINELPESVQKLRNNIEIADATHVQLKNSILQAHLYDAHQEKLAIRKHPTKLMWVFKRDWGITDQRKK